MKGSTEGPFNLNIRLPPLQLEYSPRVRGETGRLPLGLRDWAYSKERGQGGDDPFWIFKLNSKNITGTPSV